MSDQYSQMWEDFAKKKGQSYLSDKYSLDNIVGFTGRAREEEIIRALHLSPSDTVLDVGYASGRQVFQIAPYVQKAVGIDIAKNFIDVANEYAKEHTIPNVEFLCVEGEKLPFPDASFSKIICSEVIEHIPDPSLILSEIRRALTPEGLVVFTVPNLNSRGTLWKRIQFGFREPPFTPLTDFSMEGIKAHGDAHVHQFTLRRFERLVESAGFRSTYIGGAAFLDFPKIGRIIQIMNKPKIMQKITFSVEKVTSRVPLFKHLGRQIVLAVQKS